jgi:tryptophan-rich sensory protein
MNNQQNWYQLLDKPTWAPPSWLFGPVWSVLYVIIIASFGSVFYKAFTKQIPWIVAVPFALNIIFNLAFTPIQFGLRSNVLATVDIVLVLGTLVWALVVIYPYMRWVSFINIPYLAWVCFATVLQITIMVINFHR